VISLLRIQFAPIGHRTPRAESELEDVLNNSEDRGWRELSISRLRHTIVTRLLERGQHWPRSKWRAPQDSSPFAASRSRAAVRLNLRPPGS